MTIQDRIDSFLDGGPHAVVGASQDRSKYGNKVLRAYLQHNRPVFPVNPRADTVEGLRAFSSLSDLPEPVHGVSIITPPRITGQVVQEAHECGIRHVWMQPGAESEEAVARAEELGLSVIAGDACILVVLGYHEDS